MPPKKFDRFMVDVEAGRNLKLLRLTVAERWAYIHGVVALAAKSPDRGALLIVEGVPVTAQDVSVQATVSLGVAKSTLAKARALGMLYLEDGVERVHDFEVLNPAPKKDETNAERQARLRERRRNAASNGGSNADRNGSVTEIPSREVEVEELPPKSPKGDSPDVMVVPTPPAQGVGRKRDRDKFLAWCRAFADAHYLSPQSATLAVRKSVEQGARTPDAIHAHIAEWFGEIRLGAAA